MIKPAHSKSVPLMFVAIILGVSIGRLAANPRPGSAADAAGRSEIRKVLTAQTEAWNRGDIEEFMAGYLRSRQTEFVGADGIARGWQSVLDRYRKRYPDRKAMGHLAFAKLEIHVTCADSAFVIGQYQLKRDHDEPSGVFTLNFRKFPEGWKIVADHTTAFPAEKLAETE